jgi:glycosyltransferase involved in cell wall biosynthesis
MIPGMSQSPQPTDAASAPLVTVIIPTFNRANFLERCARSVLNQTYRNLECLVMDGASKDGSVDILRRLAAEDARLKFVSEPDEGEVFATNKGLDLARGEIVGVQASDDFYVPDAVETSVKYLLAHPEVIGVSGDARYVDDRGNDLGRGVITYRGEMSRRSVRRILMTRYKSCFVCHGGFFGWRKRLLAHGKFNPAYSVTPDWDFYLRLLLGGERIGFLPRIQYKYTVHQGMGAWKYSAKVENQRALFQQACGMKWYHELIRTTAGRAVAYFSNPHRSPFFSGLARELRELKGRKT